MKQWLPLLFSVFLCGSSQAGDRPNILWIVVDDMSANFSCYGETAIETPVVDGLAAGGVKFTRAYATSPVCSTFRSALITGMYQTSVGVHHHRSGRGEHRIQLPAGVRPLPEIFQKAGYWTCMGSGLPELDYRSEPMRPNQKLGKADYNFDWEEEIYDSNDWAGRDDGQPFFMQVQLHGGKLRGASEASNAKFQERVKAELGSATSPALVTLPPHYPDDPVFLNDWAAYLDSVRMTDYHVGKVLERLEEEDLLENTLIVFFTDHGISTARGKQFLYDEGTHIPLVLSGPGISPGTIREDLVEHIDVTALSLAAAGIGIPESMQGDDILSEKYRSKPGVYAARDRCGETVDRIRSVRTEKYLYLRNFYPKRPHLQPSNYKDSKAIVRRLRELHGEGSLAELSERLFFSPGRAPEELYLYHEDPWQLRNLAADPNHAAALLEHRQRLDRWIVETGDMGSESPEIYAQEIEDELNHIKPGSTRYEEFSANAELMKRWALEGK
ncbi:MAG: sulfatase [Verrucomicrobiales bacterium]|nr:sulfatase [Verrucomicrobiales bacterium]